MKSKEQRKADAVIRTQRLDDFKARAKAKELAREKAFQVKQAERKASAPPRAVSNPVLKPSAKLLAEVEQNRRQAGATQVPPPPKQRKPRGQFWGWFDSLDNNF